MFALINNNFQVPLGVLFHSEQYNDDMKEILKKVYKYVPSTASIGDGSGTGDSSQVRSFPTLFGGDQLTTERARTVRNVLSNSDSATSRLELRSDPSYRGLACKDVFIQGSFGSTVCVCV